MPMLLEVPNWYGAGDRRVYRRQEDPPLDPDGDNKRKSTRKKQQRKKKKEKKSAPEKVPTKKAHSPEERPKQRRGLDKKQEHRRHHTRNHDNDHPKQQQQQQQQHPTRKRREHHKTHQRPQQEIEFVKEFKEHTGALFDSFPWKWDLGGSSSSSSKTSEEEKPRGVPSVVFAVKDDLPSPMAETQQGHPLSPGTTSIKAPTIQRTDSAAARGAHTRPPPVPRLTRPSSRPAEFNWGGGPFPVHANRNLNPPNRAAIFDLTRLESSSTCDLEQNYTLGAPPRKEMGRESIALPRLNTPVQGVSYQPTRPVYGNNHTNASHTSSITKGLETMRKNLRDKQAALTNAVSEFQSKRTLSASESASLAEKLRQNCRRRDTTKDPKDGQVVTPPAGKSTTINQKSEHYLSGIFNDLASKMTFNYERPKEPYIPKVDGIITGQKSPESEESLFLPNIKSQRNTPAPATNLPFRPSAQNWPSGQQGGGATSSRGARPPMNIINVCGGDYRDQASLLSQEDVVDLTSQASSRYQNLIREERMRQEYWERERKRETEAKSRRQAARPDPIDVASVASSKFSKNTVKEIVCIEEDSHGIIRTKKTKKSFPRTIREEEIEIEFGSSEPAPKKGGLFDGIWDIEVPKAPTIREPEAQRTEIQTKKSNCDLSGPSHLFSGIKNSICQKASFSQHNKGSLEPPSGNQINIFANSPARQSPSPYASPKNAPQLPASPPGSGDGKGPSSPLWGHFVVRPLNFPSPHHDPNNNNNNNATNRQTDPRSTMSEQFPFVANAHRKMDAPSTSNSHSRREPEGATNIWTTQSRINFTDQQISPRQQQISPRQQQRSPYQNEEYYSPRSQQDEHYYQYRSPRNQHEEHYQYRSSRSQQQEDQPQCRLVRPTPVRQPTHSSLKQNTSSGQSAERSVEARSVTFREDDSVDDPDGEENYYIPRVITAASSDGGGMERGVPSSQKNGIRHNVHPWDMQAQQQYQQGRAQQDYKHQHRVDLFNKSNLLRRHNAQGGDKGDGKRSMYDEVYGRDSAPLSPVIILDDETDQVYEVFPANMNNKNQNNTSSGGRREMDDLTDSVEESSRLRRESDGESSIKEDSEKGTGQGSSDPSGAVTVASENNRRFFGFLCT